MCKKILLIAFVLLSVGVFSQKSIIVGSWLLIKIESSNRIQEPYFITKFDENATMSIRGYEVAEWHLLDETLDLQSKIDEKLLGKAIIVKLNEEELIYQKDDEKYFFIRYNSMEIQKNPIYKKMLGVWKISGDQTSVFRFNTNNELSQLVIFGEGTMATRGQWLFVPHDNSIVILADTDVLHGRSQITQINENVIELKNKGIAYQLERMPYVEQYEHLKFTYEELENHSGDQHDLPWDDESLLGYLKSVKSIRYSESTYENDVKTFLSQEFEYNIVVDEDESRIVFNKYRIEDAERFKEDEIIKGNLDNAHNLFFPEKEISPFRIISNAEDIQINGVSYSCTLVEGFDMETKIRYWMINDRPGVYAKIIRENDSEYVFPLYSLEELVEIKE